MYFRYLFFLQNIFYFFFEELFISVIFFFLMIYSLKLFFWKIFFQNFLENADVEPCGHITYKNTPPMRGEIRSEGVCREGYI